MIDNGYWGDDDCDCDVGLTLVRSSDRACSQSTNDALSKQQFFGDLPKRRKHKRQVSRFVDEESLREMPGRRMRRNIPRFVAVSASSEDETVAKPIISHYYSSRWLNEFFLSQHKFSCIGRSTAEAPATTDIIEKVVCDEKVLSKPRPEMSLITTCRQMLVDDAISFSLLPR